MAPPGAPPPDLVLFDGDCGLCHGAVRFILARDPEGQFHFASLGGVSGQRWLERVGLAPTLRDTMVLIEDPEGPAPRAFVRSEAALRIGRRLGGVLGGLAMVGLWLPRVLRDPLYRLVARFRHRLAGPPTCGLPAPGQRERFLDS